MSSARLKSWRMILVAAVTVATLAHPLLLQLHEQIEHDCGHEHSVAAVGAHHAPSDVTEDHGHCDGADHLGHHSHHDTPSDAVHDEPIEAGDSHDHHCFHCVLCYAAAHTGLSETTVSLSACTIDSGDAPESRTLDPLTASTNPGSPRAPPISLFDSPLS